MYVLVAIQVCTTKMIPVVYTEGRQQKGAQQTMVTGITLIKK